MGISALKPMDMRRLLQVAALTAGLYWPEAPAAMNSPTLIPLPVSIRESPGTFTFSSQTTISGGPGAEVEAKSLASALQGGSGIEFRVVPSTNAVSSIRLELDPSLRSILGTEGYRLSVRPRLVRIEAAGEAGLFYGGMTLRQLLPPQVFGTGKSPGARSTNDWSAPCVDIEDYPRFPWRGLLLDVARHYMPPESIRKLVDAMALHKLNSLQLHLTDDQGWRIEIKKYPRLTQLGSVRKESPKRGDRNAGDGQPYGPLFYTQEQLRELVGYAKARHVRLVPEIEMPGHMLGALSCFPQLSCSGGPFQVRTRWGIEPDILCAGNDEAIVFARSVLAEVMEIFPGEFIHIGGDEAPKERWKQCAKCQARIRREALKNEEELQGWFNHRMQEFVSSKGRRMIGWDEILQGGLPAGTAVMSWRGTAGGIAAARAGHDVVMSPTSHCYFDYAQAQGPGEPESIGGLIPLASVYSFEPMPAELGPAQRHHILGAQGNVWTEFIWTGREVEYFAFPRAAALAEVVWSPVKRNAAQFLSRLREHCRRLDQLGINYRRLD